MDYKEKYEMALERAKCLYSQHEVEWRDEDIEYIFPELKKSEDERIRKELITHCRNTRCVTEEGAERIAKWLAWLKKQGEKPADKKEHKFKVGDWIIFAENHNSIYQVERIDNYRYYLRHYLGCTLSVHFDNELIRPWTINDAKPGDVLRCW
ncbi:MAG: hypothetical protein II431_02635, partial [Prevotella sp.]|nr:hypothetical protein [Prevotella sp.]